MSVSISKFPPLQKSAHASENSPTGSAVCRSSTFKVRIHVNTLYFSFPYLVSNITLFHLLSQPEGSSALPFPSTLSQASLGTSTHTVSRAAVACLISSKCRSLYEVGEVSWLRCCCFLDPCAQMLCMPVCGHVVSAAAWMLDSPGRVSYPGLCSEILFQLALAGVFLSCLWAYIIPSII